jgi:hypothetical protein
MNFFDTRNIIHVQLSAALNAFNIFSPEKGFQLLGIFAKPYETDKVHIFIDSL